MRHLVTLDMFDLQEAIMQASRIEAVRKVAPSSAERIYTSSSFEGIYIGILGEIAVCKYFEVPHPHTLALGGDDGVDVTLFGYTFQIKTNGKDYGDNSKLIMTSREKVIYKRIIGCTVISPTVVSIDGVIRREKFLETCKDYFINGADRPCVLSKDLTDIDSIVPQPLKIAA